MPRPVKQVALLEVTDEPEAMAPVRHADSAALMFERLAKDPAVDVEKLERLIAMQERILKHQAKAEFDAAFSEMQGELPIIDEHGQIVVSGVIRSKFAKHEDIQAAIKPILMKFGFSINHRNKRLPDGKLLIVGVLRHKAGHSEEDEFECPPDDSGSKNDIQAIGSTREYGRRYTTISLLNIVTKNVDDDGHKSGRPQPPDGYDEWVVGLSETANTNLAAFEKAFAGGEQVYRLYLTQHDALTLAKMRTRARTGKAAKA